MYPSPCSRHAAYSKLVRGLEVGTRLQTALRGPAHQLAVHMRIIISIMVSGLIRNGMVRGTLPLGSSSRLLRCIILLRRGFCTSVPFSLKLGTKILWRICNINIITINYTLPPCSGRLG